MVRNQVEKFHYTDHSGDLGMAVFGRSMAELFDHAGQALMNIITDADRIHIRHSEQVSLRSDGREQLLIAWLNELIFRFDVHGLLFKIFEVHRVDDHCLQARLLGERLNRRRHPVKTTVKSATYHQLEVTQEKGLWRAQVILDL